MLTAAAFIATSLAPPVSALHFSGDDGHPLAPSTSKVRHHTSTQVHRKRFRLLEVLDSSRLLEDPDLFPLIAEHIAPLDVLNLRRLSRFHRHTIEHLVHTPRFAERNLLHLLITLYASHAPPPPPSLDFLLPHAQQLLDRRDALPTTDILALLPAHIAADPTPLHAVPFPFLPHSYRVALLTLGGLSAATFALVIGTPFRDHVREGSLRTAAWAEFAAEVGRAVGGWAVLDSLVGTHGWDPETLGAVEDMALGEVWRHLHEEPEPPASLLPPADPTPPTPSPQPRFSLFRRRDPGETLAAFADPSNLDRPAARTSLLARLTHDRASFYRSVLHRIDPSSRPACHPAFRRPFLFSRNLDVRGMPLPLQVPLHTLSPAPVLQTLLLRRGVCVEMAMATPQRTYNPRKFPIEYLAAWAPNLPPTRLHTLHHATLTALDAGAITAPRNTPLDLLAFWISQAGPDIATELWAAFPPADTPHRLLTHSSSFSLGNLVSVASQSPLPHAPALRLLRDVLGLNLALAPCTGDPSRTPVPHAALRRALTAHSPHAVAYLLALPETASPAAASGLAATFCAAVATGDAEMARRVVRLAEAVVGAEEAPKACGVHVDDFAMVRAGCVGAGGEAMVPLMVDLTSRFLERSGKPLAPVSGLPDITDWRVELHCAVAELGHTSTLSLLLRSPLAIDPASHASGPLRYAALAGRVETVRFLLADGRSDPMAMDGHAVVVAARYGFAEVVGVLVEEIRGRGVVGGERGRRVVGKALEMAKRFGREEVVRVLEEVGGCK
ncbi:hypothetical protein HDU96_006753 [Phlyctochytrium bullatum]|nr:hypothetical protein HDU96_006753 [Phlyctochytrium bullatum]